MEMQLRRQLGCVAGGHDSRSGRPDRQLMGWVRYTGMLKFKLERSSLEIVFVENT